LRLDKRKNWGQSTLILQLSPQLNKCTLTPILGLWFRLLVLMLFS